MKRGASRWFWALTAVVLACGGGGSGGGDDAAPTPEGGVDVSVAEGGGSDAEAGCPSCGGGDAGADAKDGGPPIVPAFYVATNGNDANPGTLAAPFATFGKAQAAMRASSSIKTTYVRAGTYQPATIAGSCNWGNTQGTEVELTAADTGETWSYYPPDGVGTAILDGQSTMGNSGGKGGNGTGCAFSGSNTANVTIVGLQFEHYLYSALWAYASSGMTFENNEVHDTTATVFGDAAVYLVASPKAVVTNNVLHDLAYIGIGITDNSMQGNAMSDSTVANNVVLNSCTWPAVSGGGNDQNGGDCGAIYLWSQVTTVSSNIKVVNNYVRDVNLSSHGAGDFGQCCAIGVYLDDGVNNVAVTGNLVTGTTSACFQIHGGQNNSIKGNLCDIGASGTEAIVTYQNDMLTQMTGNVFENNVVVAGSSGAGNGFWGVSGPPNPMTIANNAYFNYVGTAVNSMATGDNAGSDSNPTYVDPGVSCWAPSMAANSPVRAAPVSFPGIAGGWGPPGFAMPKTGTPPSWPHGC
jgi:hypothetical protein